MKRGLLIAAAILAIAPASADAANFCVRGPCPSGGTTELSLQAAINAAADSVNFPGRDRIEIGTGTLTATNASVAANNPVDIVGAGRGSTTVIGADSTANVLQLGAGSTVSDLTVRLPSGANRKGVEANGSSVARVTVDVATGGATGATGFTLIGNATVTQSAALLSNATNNLGVQAQPGTGQTARLDNVELSAETAAKTLAGGTLNARRLFVHDTRSGVGGEATGTINLTNSVLHMTGTGATGLYTRTSSGVSPVLNARHVTVQGPSNVTSPAVALISATAGEATTVNLRDSILRGFARSFEFSTGNGGTATVNVSYSDYANTSQGTGTLNQIAGNVNIDPSFTNAAAGDFSLLPTSPLIDAGDPSSPSEADEPTDLPGNPRINDGDGNGVPRTEMGAYEYQRAAPVLPVTPAKPISPVTPVTPPAVKDTVAPALSGAGLTNTSFRVSSKSTAVSAAKRKKKAPAGTTLKFRLSEAATVRIAVEQRTTGARIKSKGKTVCAKRTTARRKAKKCTRWVAIRTLTRKAKAGANTLAFTGRIAKKALKPGRYRMRLTATDAAGNKSATKSLNFKIVR